MIIYKYAPKVTQNPCQWDTETGKFVLDKDGNPIPAPRPPRNPTTSREITLARKVQNWNAHETGSSVTLNTLDNVTGCQP